MFWEKFTIIRHPTECSFPMKKKSRARLRYGIHFWCLRNAKGIGPDLSNIVLVLPREYEWEGGVRLQSQIECLLEEMRVKLSSVASDLLSVSGLCILWALARGEGDQKKLAALGEERLRHRARSSLSMPWPAARSRCTGNYSRCNWNGCNCSMSRSPGSTA